MRNMHRGFTLIELLIAITIIAVLVGMLMSGVSIVRKKQVIARTKVQMQGLSLALTSYLSDYGIIGDQRVANPTDFPAEPAMYLLVRPQQTQRRPYISAELAPLGDATGDSVQSALEARTIIDPFGKPLEFAITNDRSSPSQPYDHTVGIEIRSTAGTSATDDDLVLSFELDRDAWNWE